MSQPVASLKRVNDTNELRLPSNRDDDYDGFEQSKVNRHRRQRNFFKNNTKWFGQISRFRNEGIYQLNPVQSVYTIGNVYNHDMPRNVQAK